ncbi:hinge domain of cleavage stimulation factor subunit 2-domain-containing protein [Apiospora saccharicola]|uniref:Hinge domain of cleavage stimulation factor subunit 2-domain-containing protein n=1 Tax=Apiospora saccharicola TaxID=335842 RepID=A0ABR1WJS2_9PEZI
MSTKPPSRVVFVGNIPYGLSEEQITDIFSTAGKVLNFRLVYDRETGRPKGFGFAEYPDADSAASAVRNLNDYEVMNRKLRVDYSTEGRVDQDEDKSGPSNTANTGAYGQHSNGTANAAPQSAPAGSLPPLPPGKELPPGVSFHDAISRTLHTLPPAQLLDILTQMKSLASTDPARATELLNQAPQLSYAIFQALLLMGLVSPETIHSVVDQNAPPPVQAPPAGYPPSVMPGFPGVATSTPPVGAPFAPPVAAPQPSYASAPAAGGQDPEQLMKMVLELPQATIDQLPEAERQTIMGLRAQFMPQQR